MSPAPATYWATRLGADLAAKGLGRAYDKVLIRDADHRLTTRLSNSIIAVLFWEFYERSFLFYGTLRPSLSVEACFLPICIDRWHTITSPVFALCLFRAGSLAPLPNLY